MKPTEWVVSDYIGGNEFLMDKPSVGRFVHYVSHGTPIKADGTQAYSSQCRAAVITQVLANAIESADGVGLCVFNPTGLFFHDYVVQDEKSHGGGTWHWPERV